MKGLLINLTIYDYLFLLGELSQLQTALASIAAIKGSKYLLVTYRQKQRGFSIYYNIKSIKLYKIQRQNVAVFSLSCQKLYLNLTGHIES